MRKAIRMLSVLACWVFPVAVFAAPTQPTNSAFLRWHLKDGHVDANIDHWNLPKLLTGMALTTGWHIYVEPGSAENVSVKFKNVPEDEALRRLLGKLNYFRDQTNGITRLFVFSTVPTAATQVVKAEPKKNYRIPNELLVKMKRGAKESIDDLAKRLGAKIIGRDDKIGFYRLQFADGSTADTAMQALSSDQSVAAVDSNYYVDPPTPVQLTQTGSAPASPLFNLGTPNANGPVIGLIDTSVDPPAEFQKYMLQPVSVVGTPDPPTDQPSHGTAMLETMLGAMASDPTMIQPVVVYSSDQSTSTFDLMNGILKAISLGDNPISISSGGTGDSSVMGDLIAEAQQKGFVFYAATGNSAAAENDYPAAYPGVISVTASAGNGQLAPYANDGPGTDLIEPGTSMIVYNGGLWEVQGTSPATAAAAASATELQEQQRITASQAAADLSHSNPAPAAR